MHERLMGTALKDDTINLDFFILPPCKIVITAPKLLSGTTDPEDLPISAKADKAARSSQVGDLASAY